MSLPPARLFNLMYHALTRNASAEQRTDLDARLADAADAATTVVPFAGRRRVARPTSRVRGRAMIPGTSSHGIPAPSWWRGDRAAFRSSVRAGQELGEPAAHAVGVV